MKIGIIGAGSIGQAVARQMVRAGNDVLISNSRGPGSFSSLVQALGPGARAGTVREAADADMIVVAVPWERLRPALADLPALAGRIVIDATNPVIQPGFRMADLGGRTSSEVVAELVPGARLVKALNPLRPEWLGADPREAGGRRVIFMCGDDPAAKAEVAGLLDEVGFAVIDLGSLAAGGRLQQFPGGLFRR